MRTSSPGKPRLRDRTRGPGTLRGAAWALAVVAVALLGSSSLLGASGATPAGGPTTGGSPPSVPTSPLSVPVALGTPSSLNGFALVGAASPLTEINASLTLAPRDLAGLDAYSSLPGAPPLSSAEVQARFGPTASSLSDLAGYLAGHGLSVKALPNGLVWLVSGPASGVESAFRTTIAEYRATSASPAGSPSTLLAYTETPTVPSGLPVAALSAPSPVSGLRPLVQGVPDPSGSSGASPAGDALPSCPNGSLTPQKVQDAYNVTPVLKGGDEGQGETIGIVDAYDTAENEWRIDHDYQNFSRCYGLPQKLPGFDWPVAGPTGLNNSTSSGWGLEIALDTQWAHATAPLANISLVLSPNEAYGLYYGVDWLVALQRADVISLSWGEPESGTYDFGVCTFQCNASSDGTMATLGPVLAEAAAEGIDVFVASGDCGANGGTPSYTPWYPASDPHAVGVGGTTLNLSSSGGYGSETAWDGTASFCLNGGGSGGGFSLLPRPGWQAGQGFSRFTNATRGVPDVALVADVPLGIFYELNGEYVEGTSDAAPQWAGMGALAAEAHGDGGLPGFLTPLLYQILRSDRYTTDFHDVTTGWNGYSAGPGWDPVTGLGTPQFSSLLDDLNASTPPTEAGPGTFVLAAQPQAGVSPLPVTFTAGALPAGQSSAEYTFYYGDTGPPYQQANASTSPSNTSTFLYPASAAGNLTYAGAGSYTAFASAVSTSDNDSISLPLSINVGNAGPLQVQASVTSAQAGSPTIIHAAASGGTGPYRFAYFFGDGTYENSWASDGPVITHTYAQNGTYVLGIVANDSSLPQRGGYTWQCVTIGTSTVPCPTLPDPLVTDLVPQESRLVAGESTQVRVTVTFDGVPVSGAAVSLAAQLGGFGASVGTTAANGSFFDLYTAPGTNRTVAYGLFANATEGGYDPGFGEALLLLDPTSGPSITPWVRLAQTPATAGSSEGILIGGLVSYRGVPASGAAISVVLSGAGSGEIDGRLDASGFFATTYTTPSETAPTAVVLTVSLSLPSHTTAAYRFLLPVVPPNATVAPGVLTLALGPGSVVDMGSVPVVATLALPGGGCPSSVGPKNFTLNSEPTGGLSYWREPTPCTFVGLFSTPIIAGAYGEMLVLNLSGGRGGPNASAAGLLEVTNGFGPLSLQFFAVPQNFTPGGTGNLTVQARSLQSGEPLDRVFMLVAPDAGTPVGGSGSAVFAWTNAFGNVSFPYLAPNATETVLVNVQAVGFVYNFTQANFTFSVAAPQQPHPSFPPAPWESVPPPGLPPNSTGNRTGAGLVPLFVLALVCAAAVVILAEVTRRRPPPALHAHIAPAPPPPAAPAKDAIAPDASRPPPASGPSPARAPAPAPAPASAPNPG